MAHTLYHSIWIVLAGVMLAAGDARISALRADDVEECFLFFDEKGELDDEYYAFTSDEDIEKIGPDACMRLIRSPKSSKKIKELAYINRGGFTEFNGEKADYLNAIPFYTEALKLNPKSLDALGQRADAYYSTEQYQRAVSDATAYLKIKPNHFMYARRAWSHKNLEQYEQALADINEAIRLYAPDKFVVHYETRGKIYEKLTRYGKAISDYRTALELDHSVSTSKRLNGAMKRVQAAAAEAREKAAAAAKQKEMPPAKPAKAAATGGESSTVNKEMELSFWNSVKDSGDPDMFQAYLDQFPNGTFASLAKIKLGKLKK